MTTKDTTDPTAEGDEKSPAWYRERMEAATKTIADQRAKLERLAYKQLGLDPESGYGKAIHKTYEGDVDPENLGPLVEFANEEFDLELKTEEAPTTAKPAVSDAEGRINKLEDASTPAEPNVLEEKTDAALKAGDAEGAIATMLQQQIADGNLNIGGPEQ